MRKMKTTQCVGCGIILPKMLSGIELALYWHQSLSDCLSTTTNLQALIASLTHFTHQTIVATSVQSLQPLDVSSEGLDFDLAEMTDFDDFLITNDDLRLIDFIDWGNAYTGLQ